MIKRGSAWKQVFGHNQGALWRPKIYAAIILRWPKTCNETWWRWFVVAGSESEGRRALSLSIERYFPILQSARCFPGQFYNPHKTTSTTAILLVLGSFTRRTRLIPRQLFLYWFHSCQNSEAPWVLDGSGKGEGNIKRRAKTLLKMRGQKWERQRIAQ